MIQAAKIGAINVHGSLLPKYRGGAPVQYAIMNGDDKTGVTIIYMVKQMDAGAMLAQKEMPIGPKDDTASIFEKMSLLGRDTLLEMLPHLIAGEIKPLAQTTEFEAGTVVEVSKHELILAAAENTTYSVKILQPAGKPKLKITDYLNGVGQGLKVGQKVISDGKEDK